MTVVDLIRRFGLPTAETNVSIRPGARTGVRNPDRPDVVAGATIVSWAGGDVTVRLDGTAAEIAVPPSWLTREGETR